MSANIQLQPAPGTSAMAAAPEISACGSGSGNNNDNISSNNNNNNNFNCNANSNTTAVAASRKHVELSLELKRKLIQEHEHGVPFTLLGKKYHIATSTAANIWRKKDFFLRSRMSGSRKRCNDRSKYKIVNQVTALFVKSMLERNHKIDGEVIKRFARTAAAQCNFKDFHGSNGWLDSFKKRENVCWVRRRGERAQTNPGSVGAATAASATNLAAPSGAANPLATASSVSIVRCSDSPNLRTAAAAAAVAATANRKHEHEHHHHHHHHHHQHIHSDTSDTNQHCPISANHDVGDHSRCPSPTSSSSLSCSWDDVVEMQCARCSVAAAAAAVAALNSSDSMHERDHEIEDWFHGIPFLCQFFEEYQSMHPQQQHLDHQHGQLQQLKHQQHQLRQHSTSGGANSGCGQREMVCGGVGQANVGSLQLQQPQIGGQSFDGDNQQHRLQSHYKHPQQRQQPDASHNQMAAIPTSNSLSSNTSSSSLAPSSSAPIVQQSHQPTCQQHQNSISINDTNSSTLVIQHKQQQQQQQQQQGDLTSTVITNISNQAPTSAALASTPSSASNSSSSSSFRALGSFADVKTICLNGACQSTGLQRTNSTDMIDVLQMKTIEPPQQQQQQPPPPPPPTSSSATTSQHHQQPPDYSSNGDQSALDYDSLTQQQQQQLQQSNNSSLQDVLSNPHHRLQNEHPDMGPCQGNCGSAGMSATTLVGSDYNSDDQDYYLATNVRYLVTQESQSDELIYHDEISDHNDCCSEHYEQQISCNNGTSNMGPGSNELVLHDREPNGCGYNDISGSGSATSAASSSSPSSAAASASRSCNEPSVSQSISCHQAGDQSSLGGVCYMDEYEYENISTIRHYPLVPMSSNQMAPIAFAISTTIASGCSINSNTNANHPADGTDRPEQQQQQQHSGNQNSAYARDEQQQTQPMDDQATFMQQQEEQMRSPTAVGQQNLSLQQQSSASNYHQMQHQQQMDGYSNLIGSLHDHEQTIEHADHEEHNLLHNALMRSPEKLKLIDSIITLLNYASNYNQKMLAPLLEIKRCIERDLEVVLSDTSSHQQCCAGGNNSNMECVARRRNKSNGHN